MGGTDHRYLYSMTRLEGKFYPKVQHGGSPGDVAEQLFQEYDFGAMEVVDSDGAESTLNPGSPNASASVRFYIEPEEEGSDSVAMLFSVNFDSKGAEATVYSL